MLLKPRSSFDAIFLSGIGLGCLFLLIRHRKDLKERTKRVFAIRLTQQYIAFRDRNIVKRIADVCPLCPDSYGFPNNGHSFRKCSTFNEMKSKLHPTIYSNISLREEEESAFCAASIMPYSVKEGKIYILLSKEERNGKELYGILGGKRDCYNKGWLYRLETSMETAKAEFYEELLPLLYRSDSATFREYIEKEIKETTYKIWTGSSKAIVYVPCVPDWYMDFVCIDKPRSDEARSFKWFNIETLDMSSVHGFTIPVLHHFKNNKFVLSV